MWSFRLERYGGKGAGTHQPGASGERSLDLEAGTGRWGQSPRPGLLLEEPVKSLAWGWGGC